MVVAVVVAVVVVAVVPTIDIVAVALSKQSPTHAC